jgi:hypothetical protein
MVSGLPTKGQIIFDGVSPRAVTIARLEIACGDPQLSKDFRMIFKKIVIEK